jgi:hypothetical protein
MGQEVEAKVVAAADAVQSGVCGGVGFVDVFGAEIGQFGCFEVAQTSSIGLRSWA